MDSNRLAVFTGPGKVELRSAAMFEARRGEVVVRVRACSLCTMERRLWNGTQGGYPIAPGHEVAGVVTEVHSEGVVDVRVGQRVAVAMLDRCLQCRACRRGDTHLCTGKLIGRSEGKLRVIGGLSDFVVVPAWKVFPMPESLSFEEISLCEPLACVVHSLRQVDLQIADDVLIVGAGTMGQLHIALARLRGCRVFASDPDPAKRAAALTRGASAAFHPDEVPAMMFAATGDSGVDAVFVTSGHPDAAAQAHRSVRSGGRIVYYADFPAGTQSGFDARSLHAEQAVLHGARGQTLDDWQVAARALAVGLVDVKELVSDRFPLSQLSAALTRASEPATFRVVVQP